MIGLDIIDPARIIGADLGRTIVGAVHQDADILMREQLQRIKDRTPDATGALVGDEVGQAFTSPDTDMLVHIWTEDSGQLGRSGYTYVDYVEGPTIGVTTDPWVNADVSGMGLGRTGMWSNALWQSGQWGYHMFSASLTDDMDAITTWFAKGVGNGLVAIEEGRGSRI